MNSLKRNLGLTLLSLGLLTACGSPGEPLPPSLELAQPVSNLRAVRKGSVVTLTWTSPSRTTDGHNIRHPGHIAICRSSIPMERCGTPIARLPEPRNQEPGKLPSNEQAYSDTLASFSTSADARFVYAVEVMNSYDRSAGLSNQVEVSAALTLPPPSDLQPQLNSNGVQLTWSPATDVPQTSGLRFIYRIYRREAGAKMQVVAGEVPVQAGRSPSYLDSSIEWEKTYAYQVTVVTVIAEPQGPQQQVEGGDSPAVTVVAHDVFPPAIPTGLQAVFSGPGQKPFIDLIWAPDTDADLAGYNVYRSEGGSEPRKLNTDPVKAPAFRDEIVTPGHEYTYSVSAVDVRGNESARSEPASEKVPEQ